MAASTYPVLQNQQTPTAQSSKSFSEHFGKVELGINGYSSHSIDIALFVNVDDNGDGYVFFEIMPQDRRRSNQSTIVKQKQLSELKQLIEEAEQKIGQMKRTGQIKKINF